MDVLISWSGRQSRKVADVLYGWLVKVIPAVKPWISTQDINKGARWFHELQGYLKSAKACIVCMTPENLNAPWVYWETGAIARTQEHPICPLLINITPDDIRDGPLAQFQCTFDRKDDVWLLVRSLNDRFEKPEDQMRLRGIFESHWEELHTAFKAVAEMGIPSNILDLLNGLRAIRTKFAKRWETDRKAESWDPIKQLVYDTESQIAELLAKAGVEKRIELHIAELKSKVRGIISPNTREEVHKRGAAIPSAFDKAIDAVRADYDQNA